MYTSAAYIQKTLNHLVALENILLIFKIPKLIAIQLQIHSKVL